MLRSVSTSQHFTSAPWVAFSETKLPRASSDQLSFRPRGKKLLLRSLQGIDDNLQHAPA